MRISLKVLLSVATAAGVLAAATPAFAGTTVTVSLTPSATGLTISQPSATVMLSGSATPGGQLTGSLGTTTVTDTRGTLLGWTVTALTSGDLTNAGATHTISLGTLPTGGPLTVSVPAISVAGTGLLSGVAPGAGGSLNPSTAVTMATAAPGAGGGSFSYDPALSFTVPPNTYADTYTTVVTQTVA